jgi:hypothetical protein
MTIRIILGFSVAVVALFCFAVAGLLAGKPAFEVCRPYLAGGMVVIGVGAWFTGRVLARRKSLAPRDPEEEGESFDLQDLRYWGPMCVLLGVITLFIWPLQEASSSPTVAAPPTLKKVVAQVAPTPKPAPVRVIAKKIGVKFPVLKFQGVFVRDDSSFAIINGRSYTVGDHVGEVVVRSIHADSVALELHGEIKRFTMN